jgi:uncharacterized membrane protein
VAPNFPLSAQAIMIFALASACSRAGLNIIDRYQIGFRRQSVVTLNFFNNVVPAAVMVALVATFGFHKELVVSITDWRTAVFSGLVQIVAYAFSYAFRYLNVSQVAVAGKASDLFIPIGVLLVAGHWDWVTYGFAVATTVVCLPILRSNDNDKYPDAIKRVAFLIGVALVLQASLAPLLVAPGNTASRIEHTLAFATAVIVWRMVWSLLPMLHRGCGPSAPSFALLVSPVFIARVLLTVITQITFIIAVGSSTSTVAWPILNSTGFLAMMLSSVFLKEKPSGAEKWIIVAITALALLRFFSL